MPASLLLIRKQGPMRSVVSRDGGWRVRARRRRAILDHETRVGNAQGSLELLECDAANPLGGQHAVAEQPDGGPDALVRGAGAGSR